MQPESNNVERELAAQARAELDQAQPDWFRIKELAERGAELSRAGATPGRVVRPEVEAARARTEAMLDQVRPIVAEADGLVGEDNMARVCLEHAQQAYDRAVTAQAAEVAIDGFRLAEESANVAHEHAMGLRAQAGRKLPGMRATKLWGARRSERSE
jgi:hypothetical protein